MVQTSPINTVDPSRTHWKKVIVANKSFIGVNQQNESDYYQIKEIHEGGRLGVYKYGKEDMLYPVEISQISTSFSN